MKLLFTLLLLALSALPGHAQTAATKNIDKLITPGVALEPFTFLASDELMGRSAIRPEINIAARYIAERFKSLGVREVAGLDGYFQKFDMKTYSPAKSGSLTIANSTFGIGDNLLQMQGGDVNVNAPITFAGFTHDAALDSIDMKGRIVIVNFGNAANAPLREAFPATFPKITKATEKQAAALIIRYKSSDRPWEMFQHYYGTSRYLDKEEMALPVFIVNDSTDALPQAITSSSTGTLSISRAGVKNMPAKNVVGWVEGTDPKLKNEYVLLSAHYDHIGVSQQPKMENGKLDSIYNGARDNAIGATAVLNAARYFSSYPPKRSILFIAFTAEELGLVGSRYYASNSPIPLKKIIYNLNIDNGGYNDTTITSIIGFGRTSADNDMIKACAAYRLTAKGDPAPEENLFDRSDNVSFAAKGIPAPTFGMGVSRLDESIMKRYHQLSDETGDFDMKYALRYIKAYILAAQYIANNPVKPTWKTGDKYEEAARKLYAGD